MKDPLEHYEQNRDVYNYISERLDEATSHFAQAPRQEQKLLLNQAVSFALISAQTSVEIHEKGYLNVLDATSFTEIEQGLLDAGVNYYRNKAKYIFHNMTEPDYEMVLDHYDQWKGGDSEAVHRMHRAIADEFMGVSTRKAAFAMANIVTTDKACIDTHVAQRAGIDSDDIYNGVVIDRYEDQWSSIEAQWPDLRERLAPYLFQWVVFDSHQDTVTTHDAWFMSLPTA